jgi:hypothetical protein
MMLPLAAKGQLIIPSSAFDDTDGPNAGDAAAKPGPIEHFGYDVYVLICVRRLFGNGLLVPGHDHYAACLELAEQGVGVLRFSGGVSAQDPARAMA